MRLAALALASMLASSCQVGDAAATPPLDAPLGAHEPLKAPAPLPAGPSAPTSSPQSRVYPDLELSGRFEQSGLVIGRTHPNALVLLDDLMLKADAEGWFVLGFDRDAPQRATLSVRASGFQTERTLTITPRVYQTRSVSGLPQSRVTPTDPQDLKQIAAEREVKNVAFASISEEAGFRESFQWPVSGRITSPWGAQRVLNGVKQQPHYGIDIGAPEGTPIRAPARGLVVLAEPDMFFEGGIVAIDHGQGLISMYLHMSKVSVRAGDVVVQGAELGAVGMKGRATGPHLCWRLRWRGRQLDPSLLTPTPAPPALSP